MAYEFLGSGALDYYPCSYGDSKLHFRGPKRRLTGVYGAVLGGSETFGKYIEQPYPELLENATGHRIVNLGCMYAGPELFVSDPAVLEICRNAAITVVQLTGAQNMSNRFYAVHPRRNDRFLRPTRLLVSIFPDVDFTDVHYTGHLLGLLWETSEKRFGMVRKGLQSEWISKMQAMVSKIGSQVILLWLADHSPKVPGDVHCPGTDPMFLDREMIDEVLTCGATLVEVVTTPDEIAAGHERMIFSQLEAPAARQMLGPIAHQEAARQLQPLFASL